MKLADDCVEVVARNSIPNPEYGENGGLIGNEPEGVRRPGPSSSPPVSLGGGGSRHGDPFGEGPRLPPPMVCG